jgi:NapC/NirT cytochrome c family, N-terminal region
MVRIRFPRLAYNPISIVGAILAVGTTVLIASLLYIHAVQKEWNPYLGVVVYMVLPPVLIFGLVLIPIGMLRQRRIFEKTGAAPAPQWPRIDLNLRTHRNAFFVFLFGSIVFGLIGIVGGYQAYNYTESVTFCGETCHTIMTPEHTAYQNSPHARVACVECHVGPGAGWYAKSKLSGLYQVYATARNIYPRPIPTPIKNLRPAQETCEECHWPEKFFGMQLRRFDHYMYDDANTHWPVSMLVKTGGGDPQLTETSGIHWHMNISVKVEYVARDQRREDIPWIRVTDREGRITIYQDKTSPLTAEQLSAAEIRRMDCVDCHNRPSHKYNPPDRLVDLAISTGQTDPALPAVKRIATQAMAVEYGTTDAALDSIADQILASYTENHPEILQTNRGALDRAIAATQQYFSQNVFPEMKVRWDRYPDNLGHFIYPGCMRCHDGDHVSDQGEVVSRDCKSCHIIIMQGSGERAQMAVTSEGLEFVHPEEAIGDAWRETGCYECHTGTQP